MRQIISATLTRLNNTAAANCNDLAPGFRATAIGATAILGDRNYAPYCGTCLAAHRPAGGAALAQAFPVDQTGAATNGGLTRAQATSQLMTAGYSNVGTLKNDHGGWMGQAFKRGNTVMVTVSRAGKITSK